MAYNATAPKRAAVRYASAGALVSVVIVCNRNIDGNQPWDKGIRCAPGHKFLLYTWPIVLPMACHQIAAGT